MIFTNLAFRHDQELQASSNSRTIGGSEIFDTSVKVTKTSQQPQHVTEWAQSAINPDLIDLGFRSIGQEIDSLTITREARGVK